MQRQIIRTKEDITAEKLLSEKEETGDYAIVMCDSSGGAHEQSRRLLQD